MEPEAVEGVIQGARCRAHGTGVRVQAAGRRQKLFEARSQESKNDLQINVDGRWSMVNVSTLSVSLFLCCSVCLFQCSGGTSGR